MKKMIWNYSVGPRKRVFKKRSLPLCLLLATVMLLFISGSISVVIFLLWVGVMLSFLIMLDGLNEGIYQDGVHRNVSVDIDNKRLSPSKLFFPTSWE